MGRLLTDCWVCARLSSSLFRMTGSTLGVLYGGAVVRLRVARFGRGGSNVVCLVYVIEVL